ncbi:MAG TPA: hypothetical protein PKE26_16230 [Kiritimatiellia bacterium]|nr:hypothetical protein [Kiritimatiellia bacterium]HMP00645.1 hypothetical protein [Kiritimatiellia bacterium]
MKLKVTRNQVDMKGLFGGHKGVRFSITAKADVTPEEKELIEHYKMGDQVLARWEPDREKDKTFDGTLSVQSLLNGRTVESESLGKLQELEEQVIEGCKKLKGYLAVARSFGNEVELDIE